MAHLRETGHKTTVVGLVPGLVTGKHGVAIKTDLHFSELENETPKLLAIADGKSCVSQLLTEPRVYTLITNTLDAGGRIAATTDSETILKGSAVSKFHSLIAIFGNAHCQLHNTHSY